MAFAAPGEVSEADTVRTPISDPISSGLTESLRELIWTGQTASDRSRQTEVGMSEIGDVCERKLGYKVSGTPPVNFTADPLPSLIGKGTHLELAELVGRLNFSGRFLVETPVVYRGIPGTADLFDQLRGVLFDWKTTTKGKLNRLRVDGPPKSYVIQVNGYGAALQSVGYTVNRVALAYLPRDGALSDLWVWSQPLDVSVIDNAIDRFERIKTTTPQRLPATPNQLCGWCDHHLPGSTDLSRGCPGQTSSKG